MRRAAIEAWLGASLAMLANNGGQRGLAWVLIQRHFSVRSFRVSAVSTYPTRQFECEPLSAKPTGWHVGLVRLRCFEVQTNVLTIRSWLILQTFR